MAMRRMLIYRNELLPLSETFIVSQANALKRYLPHFTGMKRVEAGLALNGSHVVTLTQQESLVAKARRRTFLRTGFAEMFLRAIKKLRPEIVHAHFAVDAAAVLSIARDLQVPLVTTLHGYDVMCGDDELRRWPTSRAYLRRKEALWSYVGRFFCVSEYVRLKAIERGFPEQKLETLHTGVDLNLFSPSEAKREKMVLFVGRLVAKKGCVHLLRAMKLVQRNIPDAELVVVGDGPLLQPLQLEAASLSLYCRFMGKQSHDHVLGWMQRASVLAAPSLRVENGDAEGLPTVLCEAQACGLPVVVFATDGVTEAIPQERIRSMPEERNEEGLVREIIHLLRSEELWGQVSAVGRRYMETNFDLTKQTCILEQKYDEVIANHHV